MDQPEVGRLEPVTLGRVCELFHSNHKAIPGLLLHKDSPIASRRASEAAPCNYNSWLGCKDDTASGGLQVTKNMRDYHI